MSTRTVFVIDDDTAILQALSLIFRRAGWLVRGFADPALALDAVAHPPACVLLDVLMPTRDGRDVLSDLQRCNLACPVIMMSGAGDIPMAVDAMRRGAVDFVSKPFTADSIVACVERAVGNWTAKRAIPADHIRSDFPGHTMLTRRERDVLGGIAAGATAKEAALDLSISPRTVEFHRARIFEKLGARNAADLMRIVMGAVN